MKLNVAAPSLMVLPLRVIKLVNAAKAGTKLIQWCQRASHRITSRRFRTVLPAAGGGGFAEVIMSVANITTSGGSLFINNPKPAGFVPNYTVKIIAIGAQ